MKYTHLEELQPRYLLPYGEGVRPHTKTETLHRLNISISISNFKFRDDRFSSKLNYIYKKVCPTMQCKEIRKIRIVSEVFKVELSNSIGFLLGT